MERLTSTNLRKACNDPWDYCGLDNVCKRDCFEPTSCKIPKIVDRLAAYEDTGLEPETVSKIRDIVLDISGNLDRLRELAQADKEGRCVVLDMPRKPLGWGDDDQNTCLCPYCDKDLMGIPYGERMVLQCPECGQYLDATKVITRKEAEAALRREQE